MKTKIDVSQLKGMRMETGMSYQQITDKTEDLGCAVSLSTVKRVLQKGEPAFQFRYNTTILPIYRALASASEDIPELKPAPEPQNAAPGESTLYLIEKLLTLILAELKAEPQAKGGVV